MRRKPKKTRLVLNPTFRPTLIVNNRVRGREPIKLTVRVDKRPKIAGLLTRVASLGESFKSFPKWIKEEFEFLIQSGILLPEREVPREVRPDFGLTKDLLLFVPSKFRDEAATVIRGGLVFNTDSVFFQTEQQRPAPISSGIPPEKDFPSGPLLLWVLDPGTRMWVGYRAGAKMFSTALGLRSGTISIRELDPSTLELLYHCRILVPAGYSRARELYWSSELCKINKQFLTERFALFCEMIPPLQLAALRKYFRDLESEGYLETVRGYNGDRFGSHNDVMLQFIHRQSGGLLRRITGEQIIPSYSYLSAYREGAELKRHRDRPQCAWNVSLLIDAKPEAFSRLWPICLEIAGRTREIKLDFADGISFQGNLIPHWRPPLGPRERQTLALFHYVPIDFTGSLE